MPHKSDTLVHEARLVHIPKIKFTRSAWSQHALGNVRVANANVAWRKINMPYTRTTKAMNVVDEIATLGAQCHS